jgi:hypothetical protein
MYTKTERPHQFIVLRVDADDRRYDSTEGLIATT